MNEVLSIVYAPSYVKNDIRAAIGNGDVAIIHERPIDCQGFFGSGYILLDPETGSGAYKISGGSNGSLFLTYLASTLAWALMGVIFADFVIVSFPLIAAALLVFASNQFAAFILGLVAMAIGDDDGSAIACNVSLAYSFQGIVALFVAMPVSMARFGLGSLRSMLETKGGFLLSSILGAAAGQYLCADIP